MARSVSLFLSVLLVVIGALATLRLALVVAGTPRSSWLDEYPRMIEPDLAVSPAVLARTTAVSRVAADPSLARVQLAACRPANEICRNEVDDALRVDPSSSELWSYRASLFVRTLDFREELYRSLRSSYVTGPREGWIAGGRVIFGLGLYPVLPEDLRGKVVGDLDLVLRNASLSGPLVERYATDPAFRTLAAPAFEQISPEVIEWFIGRVREVVRTGT